MRMGRGEGDCGPSRERAAVRPPTGRLQRRWYWASPSPPRLRAWELGGSFLFPRLPNFFFCVGVSHCPDSLVRCYILPCGLGLSEERYKRRGSSRYVVMGRQQSMLLTRVFQRDGKALHRSELVLRKSYSLLGW